MIRSGFERDRIGAPGLMVRWWFYVHAEGELARPQRPRLGVPDEGFHFARGGRVESESAARRLIEEATREATREIEFWRGQPSHALVHGRLVPLGAPEIEP